MSQANPGQPEAGPLGSNREIALSSLVNARAYLANVCSAVDKVTELLRQSRLERAHELYAHCLDALNVLVVALTAAGAQLGPAGEPLLETEQACGAWIDALLDAQTRQDWTALADCLEHEVAPELATWNEKIATALEASAS